MAGLVNSILMHGHQLAGPFLDAVDLLGTFVFALSGAAAGVKSRFDLFGLMALSFAACNVGGDHTRCADWCGATSGHQRLALSRGLSSGRIGDVLLVSQHR